MDRLQQRATFEDVLQNLHGSLANCTWCHYKKILLLVGKMRTSINHGKGDVFRGSVTKRLNGKRAAPQYNLTQ